MHKLIKESLEESFMVLNQNLIVGDDHSKLDVVIDTIKQAAAGEFYINDIADIFKNHPNVYNTVIQQAVSEIIDILDGVHKLIDKCAKEDKAESPLGYRCELTYEIITNVNFLNIDENGDIMVENVSNMSFISEEVDALGKLSIVDPDHA